MFKRALCVACFPFLLFSCDLGYEHFPPHLSYEADFAPSRIVEVEGLVRESAERRGIYLHEKDKSVITSQWHEYERFSMFLFRDEEAFRREREIMWIASLDTNLWIMVMNTDWHGIPIDEVELLAAEVKAAFESRLGLELCQKEPAKLACDANAEPDLVSDVGPQ